LRLIILILFFFSAKLSAAVYQYQDENGNIVFSDKEVPGSVERKIQSPPIIKFRKEEQVKKEIEATDNSFTDIKVTENKDKPKPYTKFKIKKPINDESFRDNMGNVHLQLDISPGVQTQHGHTIKVEFDGKMLTGSWSSASISFSNVNRGTHTIRAFIVDKTGKKIKSTNTNTFHLQRFSALFR